VGASTRLERTIEWFDTDASGHQHNSTIVRLVEAAEAKLARERGLTDYFPSSPRVRQEIDFEAKLYFSQPTTTIIAVERIGRTSMTLVFEVWAEEFEGRPRTRAAKGKVVTAHVPPGSVTAQPWPEHIVAALAPGQGDRGGPSGPDAPGAEPALVGRTRDTF
jgi:acyl-CoA thioester hydrolase